METVVSMLQEDAITPATAYIPPPKKKKKNYRPCWYLQQHSWGPWGLWHGDTLQQEGADGAEVCQEKLEKPWQVPRSPHRPAFSQGPQRGWPRSLCRGGLAAPHSPLCSLHPPRGSHGAAPGVPPRKGKQPGLKHC